MLVSLTNFLIFFAHVDVGTDMAPEDVPFCGDNESIFTGDTKEFYNLQRYAWEEYGAVSEPVVTSLIYLSPMLLLPLNLRCYSIPSKKENKR